MRILKAAALTAALSAAALVGTPAIAFADQSHARPVALHCDACHLPSNGAADHGRGDGRRMLGENHRGGADDRGGLTENHRVVGENHRVVTPDRRGHHRRGRTIVVAVNRNAGPLMRGQRLGGDWPDALHAGSSAVRVGTTDSATYRAVNHAGSVRIVVHGDHTQCTAQGHLRCQVAGPSLVRIFRF